MTGPAMDWLGQAGVSLLFAGSVALLAPRLARSCGVPLASRAYWRSAWLLAAWPVPLSILLSPFVAPTLSPMLPLLMPLHDYGSNWIVSPEPAAVASSDPPWSILLLAAYLTGVIASAARLVSGVIRLRRLTAGADPLDLVAACDSSLAHLQREAQWLRAHGIEMRVIDAAIGPYACSGRQPRIVLPRVLLPRLDAMQWRLVLRHELAHLRHRDAMWAWLMRITGVLLWFNPMLRGLARRAQLAAELACDAEAIAGQEDMRRAYAEAYLETLRMSVARTLPCPATAFPPQDQGSHRMRITHIVEGDPQARKRPWRSAALAAFALASGVTLVAVQAASPAPTFEGPIIEGRISSSYGHRRPQLSPQPHRGVDLTAARGTPVHAPAAGIVVIATERYTLNPDYGTVVMLDHGDGWQTLYAHLDRLDVSTGQRVAAGGVLGGLGSTGRATGPHVHVEVLHHGERMDPASVIANLTAPR